MSAVTGFSPAWGMTIRPSTSATLTQCWYTRTHAPASRKAQRAGEYFTATCRYCQRPIHSQTGKHWSLSDGIDLDALATQSARPFICVKDTFDGMVVARYPLDPAATQDDVDAQLATIRARYEDPSRDRALEFSVIGRIDRSPPL